MRTKNIQPLLDQDDLIAIDALIVRRDDKFLKEGDILVSSANSWNLVGKCCWVPKLDYTATAGGFISILRAESTIYPRFLYWWFSYPRIQQVVRSFGNKTTNISNLDHKRTLKLQIPLPPLAEQKRIAAILDAADALRAKRRQSLIELDTLIQSTFLDLFGDPVHEQWNEGTLESVIQKHKGAMRTGPFGSNLKHDEFVESGIRVLGIDNAVHNEFKVIKDRFITPEKYEKLQTYTVYPEDVIITIMGTCGRCAIVPKDFETAINTKHLCCISLDQSLCLPSYLHRYFLTHPIARHFLIDNAKGAIMNGLNMTILKRMPLAIPPLDLQQQFANIVEKIEAQKARYQSQLDELDTLFASLQSRAFKGEL